MAVVGRGRILIWGGASLWVLESENEVARTDFHSHHAIQITLALEGSFELATSAERQCGPAIVVAADARHFFHATGLVAFLFVEPESNAGRAIAAACFQGCELYALPAPGIARHIAALASAFRARADDVELVRLAKDILLDLGGGVQPIAPDRRVRAMIAYAAANLDDPVSLSAAAKAVGLSESRARHLFVEQTGAAFKTYVLWLRLKRAVEIYAAGASLTEAAHEAGFADSAHLSRTFRRTFGLPAAALRVNNRSVQAEMAREPGPMNG